MDHFKTHKETEQKIHEALYTNLILLSEHYPTTKEFDNVFRKDMFVKNNKSAFFEVIHYLLNILNPQLTEEKLPSWPIYDIKRETKFRSELINYLNELNSSYENADIPICQASSLISPGGFRFAKFMLKISQLVLHEHLKKSNEFCHLYRLRPNKNIPGPAKTPLNHLKKETMLVENETKIMLQNFEKHHFEMNVKAEVIRNKLTNLNEAIRNAKKELVVTQNEFNNKYPSYPSVTSLEEKVSILKQQNQKITELRTLFNSCEKLLQQLSSSDMSLEHDEDTFTVPTEVQHIIKNKKELNLVEYIQGLTLLIERRTMELSSPTNSYIKESMEKLDTLLIRYENLSRQLQDQQDQIDKLLEKMNSMFKSVVNLKDDNSTLAVPF